MPTRTKATNPVDKHVGMKVRQRRLQIEMSQEVLAKQLNLTFQQVQKYEKGVNRIGSSRLQQIADALRVPVAWFFDGAPGDHHASDNKEGRNETQAFTRFIGEQNGMQIMAHWSALAPHERGAIGMLARVLATKRSER